MAAAEAGTAAANVGTLGLFSSIAGIFGSSQEKRAAAESRRIINEARMQGIRRSAELNAEFTPFIESSRDTLADSKSLLEDIIGQTQGLDVGSGLSGADEIAYQDAAKLLTEQMVSTGNLRSGAAAFGQAQLLRRVVADANERRFAREATKLQLLFGGQGQMTQIASTGGQIGLYGKQLSAQLLQASMGLAPAEAGAELKKGAALSQQIGFGGAVTDKLWQAAASSGLGDPGQFGHIGEYSKVTNF